MEVFSCVPRSGGLRVSFGLICLPASDAAVKRSQAASETGKQEEPHQSERRENALCVRGCVGREAFVERACRFGVGCAEDRVSFYAVGEGARQVAVFRTTSLTR